MNLDFNQYDSLTELKGFIELPDSKPFAIINRNLEVIFCNKSFFRAFNIPLGQNISEIDSEPNLSEIINGFLNSKYFNVNLDLIFKNESLNKLVSYYLSINRIIIKEEEYYLLLLKSFEEQKNLEERITNLHDAIDYGNVAIIITDPSGIIKFISRDSEIILRKDVSEIYNVFLPEALKKFLTKQQQAEMSSAIESKNDWQGVIAVASDLTGEKWYKEIKISPVKRTAVDLQSFIVTFNDITEHIISEEKLRRAYEKESQLNKLKSVFLANMSHEIRTPATAIVGFANLIQDDVDSENYDSIKEITNYMRDGVNRLLKLVDNIIEVSLLDSGEFIFEVSSVNLDEAILSTQKRINTIAQSKNVKLNLELNLNQATCKVDEEKFKKLLIELIENSIKYNKENGTVTIKSFVEGSNCVIKVIDTGKGIESDRIDTVLQPFMQEEEEGMKRRFEGAGLGLTVAFKLTKKMNGDFKIESRINEGTTVTICFNKD